MGVSLVPGTRQDVETLSHWECALLGAHNQELLRSRSAVRLMSFLGSEVAVPWLICSFSMSCLSIPSWRPHRTQPRPWPNPVKPTASGSRSTSSEINPLRTARVIASP